MLGEPKVMVECDRCRAAEELEMCSCAGRTWDMRYVRSQLERMGWIGDSNSDEHLCPDCVEKRGDKPK